MSRCRTITVHFRYLMLIQVSILHTKVCFEYACTECIFESAVNGHRYSSMQDIKEIKLTFATEEM